MIHIFILRFLIVGGGTSIEGEHHCVRKGYRAHKALFKIIRASGPHKIITASGAHKISEFLGPIKLSGILGPTELSGLLGPIKLSGLMGPTNFGTLQTPCAPGAPVLQLKQQKLALKFSLSTAQFKNQWSSTPTLLCVFMA